jgi:hypothetical protein
LCRVLADTCPSSSSRARRMACRAARQRVHATSLPAVVRHCAQPITAAGAAAGAAAAPPTPSILFIPPAVPGTTAENKGRQPRRQTSRGDPGYTLPASSDSLRPAPQSKKDASSIHAYDPLIHAQLARKRDHLVHKGRAQLGIARGPEEVDIHVLCEEEAHHPPGVKRQLPHLVAQRAHSPHTRVHA